MLRICGDSLRTSSTEKGPSDSQSPKLRQQAGYGRCCSPVVASLRSGMFAPSRSRSSICLSLTGVMGIPSPSPLALLGLVYSNVYLLLRLSFLETRRIYTFSYPRPRRARGSGDGIPAWPSAMAKLRFAGALRARLGFAKVSSRRAVIYGV